LDLICVKCGRAIRGPHISALNKKYHLDHFTCTVCDVVFQPNASYYEHDGKIYCQTHYAALFAQRCGGCHTPVLTQLIEVNENTDSKEQWHPSCYMIYKSWNVKLELENEVSKDSIDPKDYVAVIEKQKFVKEKIDRIWTVLSAFEESSAECMTEILSCLSDNLYLKYIEQASNFVCHVEVLFSGIDEIEAKLKKFNDKTGLQHTKEPKLLAKKIVNFFLLLKHLNGNSNSNSSSLNDSNQELKNEANDRTVLQPKKEKKHLIKKIGNLFSSFKHKNSSPSQNTNKEFLINHENSRSKEEESTQEFLNVISERTKKQIEIATKTFKNEIDTEVQNAAKIIYDNLSKGVNIDLIPKCEDDDEIGNEITDEAKKNKIIKMYLTNFYGFE